MAVTDWHDPIETEIAPVGYVYVTGDNPWGISDEGGDAVWSGGLYRDFFEDREEFATGAASACAWTHGQANSGNSQFWFSGACAAISYAPATYWGNPSGAVIPGYRYHYSGAGLPFTPEDLGFDFYVGGAAARGVVYTSAENVQNAIFAIPEFWQLLDPETVGYEHDAVPIDGYYYPNVTKVRYVFESADIDLSAFGDITTDDTYLLYLQPPGGNPPGAWLGAGTGALPPHSGTLKGTITGTDTVEIVIEGAELDAHKYSGGYSFDLVIDIVASKTMEGYHGETAPDSDTHVTKFVGGPALRVKVYYTITSARFRCYTLDGFPAASNDTYSAMLVIDPPDALAYEDTTYLATTYREGAPEIVTCGPAGVIHRLPITDDNIAISTDYVHDARSLLAYDGSHAILIGRATYSSADAWIARVLLTRQGAVVEQSVPWDYGDYPDNYLFAEDIESVRMMSDGMLRLRSPYGTWRFVDPNTLAQGPIFDGGGYRLADGFGDDLIIYSADYGYDPGSARVWETSSSGSLSNLRDFPDFNLGGNYSDRFTAFCFSEWGVGYSVNSYYDFARTVGEGNAPLVYSIRAMDTNYNLLPGEILEDGLLDTSASVTVVRGRGGPVVLALNDPWATTVLDDQRPYMSVSEVRQLRQRGISTAGAAYLGGWRTVSESLYSGNSPAASNYGQIDYTGSGGGYAHLWGQDTFDLSNLDTSVITHWRWTIATLDVATEQGATVLEESFTSPPPYVFGARVVRSIVALGGVRYGWGTLIA